jgi:hypothetical protein
MFFDDGSWMKVKHFDLGRYPFSFGGRKVAIYERDSFKVRLGDIVGTNKAQLGDLLIDISKYKETLTSKYKGKEEDRFLTILCKHIMFFTTEVKRE